MLWCVYMLRQFQDQKVMSGLKFFLFKVLRVLSKNWFSLMEVTQHTPVSVSYTHLTLPTNHRV